MDATAAFVTTFAIATAGAAVAHFVVRAGVAAVEQPPVPDGAAWRETHRRRMETFGEFVEPAEQIGNVAMMWPMLPPEVRHAQREEAREYLRTLEQRRMLLALDGGPGVQDAAQQLLEECTRLVEGLDVDAPHGPVDTTANRLTRPFLLACRDYLDAESARHFGLRPAGRSLFARLAR